MAAVFAKQNASVLLKVPNQNDPFHDVANAKGSRVRV